MVHRKSPGLFTDERQRPLPGLVSSREYDLSGELYYAVACHQAGEWQQAEKAYRKILKQFPKHFDSLHLLGVVEHYQGSHKDALRHIDQALKIEPKAADAYTNRAAVLRALGRSEEALASCDKAIALKPDGAEAFNTRGAILNELKRFEEAVASCDRAIALKPDYAAAYSNRGNALKELKRRREALASLDSAVALNSQFADAHNNRANVLNQLERYEEALAGAEQAIALKPDLAEAHYNRGIALDHLKRYEEAVTSYDRAIALKADYAEAWFNRAAAHLNLKRYKEMLAGYAQAEALGPSTEHLRGMHLYGKMLVCDWTNFEADRSWLNDAVGTGSIAAPPFQILTYSRDPAIQQKSARRFVADRYTPFPDPLWRGELNSHQRIRVAYLSADFGDHVVAQQTVGVFEQHDRSRFETTAISYGPDSPGPMRARLTATFDRFIDAQAKTAEEVARLVRELEIDIAVDLNGFTEGSRPEVLTLRPAPVAVNFLGYPGTLGGACWDYIIADDFVIPEGGDTHYQEQVVRLPDCFMPNDASRRISARTPSRAEAGLPDSGFVFCCFNNAYKLTPDMFDVWMRLLARVEGSVLWLSGLHVTTVANLQREAAARGIRPDRLVFASRVPLNEDHLGRLRLADLFVDTRYYNAHATAADALWAGVPVLTCAGSTFASRVAGSLLRAVGLPELVTVSLPEYEELALRLAHDAARLSSLREKLARNRETFPLFDTARFTRQLEAAYTAMWERAQRGEPPQGFAVAT